MIIITTIKSNILAFPNIIKFLSGIFGGVWLCAQLEFDSGDKSSHFP